MLVPLELPDKLLPVTAPIAATLLGVISPNVSVRLGVAPLEDIPLIPLAVVTPIAVTVPFPVPGVNPSAVVTSDELNVIAPVLVLKDVTGKLIDVLLAEVSLPFVSTVNVPTWVESP